MSVNIKFYDDLLNWRSLHRFQKYMKIEFLSKSIIFHTITRKKCFSSSMQFLLQTKQSGFPLLYSHISLFVYVKYELPISV